MWVKLYHQHPIACVAAVYIKFMLIIYTFLQKHFLIIYEVEVGFRMPNDVFSVKSQYNSIVDKSFTYYEF